MINQWRCELLLGSNRSNKKSRQCQNDKNTFEQTHKALEFRLPGSHNMIAASHWIPKPPGVLPTQLTIAAQP